MRIVLIAAGIAIASLTGVAQAHVTRVNWGTAGNGQTVSLYTISNNDLSIRVTNFGARLVSIEAPDRSGVKANVLLGYDNFPSYEKDKFFFGAVVGRYANRIARGTFSIKGDTYHVPLNNGANALHGGPDGFFRKIWSARIVTNGIEMTLVSPDNDMGFPGTLTVHLEYLLHGHSLLMKYSATTTKPTVVALTNHSYFDLKGNGQGRILDEMLTINADRYTPVNRKLIPTGQLAEVAGTPFDFRKATVVGFRIDEADAQLKIAGGYDENFVLNSIAGSDIHLAARLYDPDSGRTLTLMTTEPGLQFYSGNNLNGSVTGNNGVAYPQYAALCLEPQHFPDSPNEPGFPSTLLKPGHTLHSVSIYTFGVNSADSASSSAESSSGSAPAH